MAPAPGSRSPTAATPRPARSARDPRRSASRRSAASPTATGPAPAPRQRPGTRPVPLHPPRRTSGVPNPTVVRNLIGMETSGPREGLLPETVEFGGGLALARVGSVGLAPCLGQALAGLFELGFQVPDRVLQVAFGRGGGFGGFGQFSHSTFGQIDFLAVAATALELVYGGRRRGSRGRFGATLGASGGGFVGQRDQAEA